MNAAYFFALLAGAGALAATVSLRADPLKVGEPAPAVTGITQTGAPLNLGGVYKEHPYTLVYFYPKAFTSGCTTEGCALRDAYSDLTKHGVEVIGVSTDPVEKQAQFKEAEHFPFTLIADTDRKVMDAFGVPPLKLLKVKLPGTLATRQSFLIDRSGKIVWADYKAKPADQAKDVLAFIAESDSGKTGS